MYCFKNTSKEIRHQWNSELAIKTCFGFQSGMVQIEGFAVWQVRSYLGSKKVFTFKEEVKVLIAALKSN